MRNFTLSILVAFTLACGAAPALLELRVEPPIILIGEVHKAHFSLEWFKVVVAALDEQCPLNAGVMISVSHIPQRRWGDAIWNKDTHLYHLRIDSRQPMHAVLDTLIHEWAHAMVWDVIQEDVHGPLWGVAYSQSYGALLSTFSRQGLSWVVSAIPRPCYCGR